MESPRRSKSKPDFTGVWKQIKNENASDYLSAMGYSLLTKALALKFIGKSTDLVNQNGDIQEVTTLNARGKWERMYVEGKTTETQTADGQAVRSTAWWEKMDDGTYLYKIKLEGAKQGTLETWRWIDKDSHMRVKSIVHVGDGEDARSASMTWHFQAVSEDEVPLEFKASTPCDSEKNISLEPECSIVKTKPDMVQERWNATPIFQDASSKHISSGERNYDWIFHSRNFNKTTFPVGSSLESSWMTRFNAALSVTSQFDF